MELLFIIGIFVALALVSAMGLTADSRDYPRFGSSTDSPFHRPRVD